MDPVLNCDRSKPHLASPSLAGISNLKKLIIITFFSTISFLLMAYFEIPILPGFPMFKYDASEVPALIAGFALGTTAGVYVVFLKTLLYFLISGKGFATFGLGPFMSLIAGSTLVFVATKIYFIKRTKKTALAGMIFGTIAMTAVMLPLNYFAFGLLPLILPNIDKIIAYNRVIYYLVVGVLPFNLIKGILTSVFAFLLYKKISPYLKDKPPV